MCNTSKYEGELEPIPSDNRREEGYALDAGCPAHQGQHVIPYILVSKCSIKSNEENVMTFVTFKLQTVIYLTMLACLFIISCMYNNTL